MWAGEPHLHVLTRVFARAQPVVTAVKTEKHQPIRDCGHGRLCQSCVSTQSLTANTVLATDSYQVFIGDEDVPLVGLLAAAVVLVTLIVACTLCLLICWCRIIYCKKRRARRNYHRISTNNRRRRQLGRRARVDLRERPGDTSDNRDTQAHPEPEPPPAPEISSAAEISSAPVAQRPAPQEQLPETEENLAESARLLDDPPPIYDSVVGDRYDP